MKKFKDIINYLESFYPLYLKASYDNPGLMVGDKEKEVNKVLVALDLTKETLLEAINNNVDLVITHHPLIFNPLTKIDYSTGMGEIIVSLIKNDIALYSTHTNFDSAKMNDYLGKKLGLYDLEILNQKENIGVVGYTDYSDLKEFSKHVKEVFKIDEIFYYGDLNTELKRVALCAGSGSSLMYSAKDKNSDVYITGDVSYSRGIEAIRENINIMDVGHFVENLFTEVIKDNLNELDNTITVFESKVNPVPYVKL